LVKKINKKHLSKKSIVKYNVLFNFFKLRTNINTNTRYFLNIDIPTVFMYLRNQPPQRESFSEAWAAEFETLTLSYPHVPPVTRNRRWCYLSGESEPA